MAKTALIHATRAGVRVSRATGVLLLGLVLLTMVLPRFTAIPYNRALAIGSFVVLLVLTVVLGRSRRPAEERTARLLAVPVGVACTAVTAFVGYASYYVPTWDPKFIQNLVSRPRDAVSPSEIAYLSRYPNNDVLLALARQARWLGDALGLDYGIAFLAIQVLCFAIALWGVYRLTALMADRTAAVVAMVLLTALIGVSPWIVVPYTDIPSMWTPVWAVYCFARASRSRLPKQAAAWAATGGAVLALGYSLKVTPVAVVVAGALWFVALAARQPSRDSWARSGVQVAALGAGLVACFVVLGPVSTRLADPPRTDPGVAAPSWHYVAGGLREQVGPNHNQIFGGYDRLVNVATSGRPTADQTRISQDFVRKELERRGVLGTLAFEVNKLDFNWGDGMFWVFGEGTDLSRAPVHHGAPLELVQSWNSPVGQLFGARVALTQGLWWLVLTLVGFGWLRGRVTAESLLVLISLVGIAGFTLLFQGRSRYLITYLPLVAVAAVWWWRDFWSARPQKARGTAVTSSPGRGPAPDGRMADVRS